MRRDTLYPLLGKILIIEKYVKSLLIKMRQNYNFFWSEPNNEKKKLSFIGKILPFVKKNGHFVKTTKEDFGKKHRYRP
jgi:hypothetical protein